MSEPILSADEVYDLVVRFWPGEQGRILNRLGIQSPQLRAELASDGGDIIGVSPPLGYTETTLNALLAEIAASIGGGGVTDHGALSGLSDDDHPQYLNEARGDARYDGLGAASAAIAAHEGDTTAHPASSITFDDTNTAVMSGATVQAALESTDVALVAARSTGIQFGGNGSVVGGIGVGTTVNVTAGRGSILDSTVPTALTYASIDFGPYSGVAVANTGVPLTWWYIDSAGLLQQQITEPTTTEYRTKIFLFRTGFTGGVISSLVPIVNPTTNTAANLGDLARAIGVIYEEGGRVRPNGANLNINRQSGKIIYWGGGYNASYNDPHEVSLSAATPLSFRMILSTGNPGSFTTTLPVGMYESGGVATAVPGASTRTTIFTVFQFPSGNVVIQYGNAFYNTIADARVAISNGTRTFTPNPSIAAADGITAGFIIVQAGATNLSVTTQAQFLDTNKFGELGGGAAAAEVARWGGIIGNVADQLDLGTAATQSVETIRLIPQNIQNANYTLVLADGGKHLLKNNTTAYAWTIPPNSSVAFPIGTAVTMINDGTAGAITITQGAGVTIRSGATSGNVTLAADSQRTAIKIGTDRWRID